MQETPGPDASSCSMNIKGLAIVILLVCRKLMTQIC